MKITSLRTVGCVAAVAIVAIVTSCKDKGTATETTGKKEVTISADEKIVYVNSDSLLSKYQYFKDMQAKLDLKSKNARADMQSKVQAFQREATQYQQQANTMPADQRAATEQRLARKQQELQAYEQNASLALQGEQSKEQEKLYDKVAEYLKGYAKQKGFKLVLTYSKGNSAILFADESLDVTTEVLKGLNDAYVPEKK